MVIGFLLVLLKGFGISLLASLMLLWFFIKTVNSFPIIRTLFRILHRLSSMIVYITPISIFLLFSIFTTNLVLSARGVVSRPYNSAERIFIQSWEITLISLFSLLCVFLIVCTATIHILKLNHRIQYEKYGTLGEWGKQTRRFKKEINWMPVVLEQLVPLFQLQPAQYSKLKIMAPAANDGREELALAEELAGRMKCKVQMWASDGTLMDHQAPVTTSQVEFTYNLMDADKLREAISDPQDMIYDPKGILWFSLGKQDELLLALRLFYDLLSPNGFILIDAHDENKKAIHLNRFRLLFGLKIRDYCEPSTYNYIHKCFINGSAASELFTIEMIYGLDGAHKMAILRKRPVAESKTEQLG